MLLWKTTFFTQTEKEYDLCRAVKNFIGYVLVTLAVSSTAVRKNKIQRNSEAGISIWTSGSPSISQNEIFENGDFGIVVSSSDAPVLLENNIHNNLNNGNLYIAAITPHTAIRVYSGSARIEQNIIGRNIGGIEVERDATPTLVSNFISSDNEIGTLIFIVL